MREAAGRTIAILGLACLPATIVAASSGQPQEQVSVIRADSGPSAPGGTENFTGSVEVTGRFQRAAPARVGGATVTFAPGARTAWHTHPLGQTLIITRGHGLVQQWGQPARRVGPGDIIWIPPATRHWHGAVPVEAMTHVAIAEMQGGKSVSWMEQVSDAQYDRAARDPAP